MAIDPLSTAPAPPSSASVPGPSDQKAAPDSDNSPSFSDLLDIINPLQHIPVISTIYRAVTHDTITPMDRVIGDALYGGPIGAACGVASAIFEKQVGKDPGAYMVSLVMGDDAPAPKDAAPPASVQVADAQQGAAPVSAAATGSAASPSLQSAATTQALSPLTAASGGSGQPADLQKVLAQLDTNKLAQIGPKSADAVAAAVMAGKSNPATSAPGTGAGASISGGATSPTAALAALRQHTGPKGAPPPAVAAPRTFAAAPHLAATLTAPPASASATAPASEGADGTSGASTSTAALNAGPRFFPIHRSAAPPPAMRSTLAAQESASATKPAAAAPVVTITPSTTGAPTAQAESPVPVPATQFAAAMMKGLDKYRAAAQSSPLPSPAFAGN